MLLSVIWPKGNAISVGLDSSVEEHLAYIQGAWVQSPVWQNYSAQLSQPTLSQLYPSTLSVNCIQLEQASSLTFYYHPFILTC